MPRFEVRCFEYLRAIRLRDKHGKLIDDFGGLLCFLQPPVALNHVHTLAVINERKQDEEFVLLGFSERLPNLLSRRLAVQVCQHGPTVQYDHFTSGLSHAAAPLLAQSAAISPVT